ncbi:MAG: hypothetical protein SP1CHLAM54_05230 [Chlamydiia bacterium]|nr:hypothetical protein [Chlamydiia bacterium]MCH9615435.1 hypothetical protein [Chlamydiia bacterium]MCH9628243.1 hypothetical protein [Chlamydiia bacterium]
MSDVRIYFGPSRDSYTKAALEYAQELLGSQITNLREYFPEGKTAMHSISTIREIKEEAMTRPFEGEHKVLIIHGADRMLPSGANALLKTLEEPYETTHILLLTHDLDSILPTILSRCTKYPYLGKPEGNVLSLEQIDKLKEKAPFEWATAVDQLLEQKLTIYKEVEGISELISQAREAIHCNMKLKNVLDGLHCQIQAGRHNT